MSDVDCSSPSPCLNSAWELARGRGPFLAPHYPNFVEESTKNHSYSQTSSNTRSLIYGYLIRLSAVHKTFSSQERAKSWLEAAVAEDEEVGVVGKVRLPKYSGERLRDTQ
jgi:hypothetical protein